MASLNFKKGITKILSGMCSDFTVSKNALELVNKVLQVLNNVLVNKCLDNAEGIMAVEIAENAVAAIFPENLKGLALAEAARSLLLYSNGMLEYSHERKLHIKRKKTKKALEIAALEFKRGISDLTALCFPGALLQDQSMKFLCELLEELAIKMSDAVKLNVTNNITLADIRNAVDNIFPQQLSRHALAEGARMVTLFELGMLKEPDRERKSRPSEITPRIKRERKLKSRKATRSGKRRKVIRKAKEKRVVRRKKRPPSETTLPLKHRKKEAAKFSRRKAIRKKPATRRKVTRKASPRKRVSRRRAIKTKEPARRKSVVRKRKRAPSEETTRVKRRRTKEKEVRKIGQRKGVSKRRASRKKREVKRKDSRKRSAAKKTTSRRTAPSRKRTTSRKKKSAVEKRPVRVSPKRVRRISRKKPPKAKLVSEKVTTKKATTSVSEITQGIIKLNKSYRQKLPEQSLRIIVERLRKLSDCLIVEMKKGKYSVIGPQEVRSIVKKVFPPKLAEMAIAQISRVVMNI